MKNSNPKTGLGVTLSLVTLMSSAPLFGAISYNFNAEGDGDFFTNAVTGWTQSPANPTAFGIESPMAYIADATFGGVFTLGLGSVGGVTSPAGVIGTLRGNLPSNGTTTVSTSLASMGTAAGKQVSLNLGIFDDPSDTLTTRDEFGVNVLSSGGSALAAFALIPTPGNVNTWDVGYSVNGGPVTPSSMTIEAGFGYLFLFDFKENSVSLNVAFGSGASNVEIAEPALIPGSSLGDFQITHDGNDPAFTPGNSGNALRFDNLLAVPEPTSIILLLATLPLSLRRRR
jgi:hypothetical protein